MHRTLSIRCTRAENCHLKLSVQNKEDFEVFFSPLLSYATLFCRGACALVLLYYFTRLRMINDWINALELFSNLVKSKQSARCWAGGVFLFCSISQVKNYLLPRTLWHIEKRRLHGKCSNVISCLLRGGVLWWGRITLPSSLGEARTGPSRVFEEAFQ